MRPWCRRSRGRHGLRASRNTWWIRKTRSRTASPWGTFGPAEARDARWENGRAHGVRLPAQQELERRAAHAALTRSHAAAGLELGVAPSGAAADALEGDILAAADQRVVLRQALEFLAQGECPIERRGEPAVRLAGGEEGPRGIGLSRGGEPGDFAVHERQVEATDPGDCAGSVDAGNGGLLVVVHRDAELTQPAAQQGGKFDVGDQTEAAGQVVAGFAPGLAGAVERDALQLGAAIGGDGPARAEIARSQQAGAQFNRLPQLSGMAGESQGEAYERGAAGLLGDQPHIGTVSAQVSGDRQEQRAAAGDHDFLA